MSDCSEKILSDHLQSAIHFEKGISTLPEEIFLKYVLSPRINFEMLSPWRSFIQKELGKNFQE